MPQQSKPLEIVIIPQNISGFMGCASLIQHYINQGMDIPFGLVDVLFDFMYNKKRYEKVQQKVQINKEAINLAAKANEILVGSREYQFEWKDRIVSGKKIKHNQELILFELMYAYVLYRQDHSEINKEETIAFFYDAIAGEYCRYAKYRRKFSKYKWGVVSGVLAIAVGFRLTNKNNPSLRDIFQATRNAAKNRNRIFKGLKRKVGNESHA